ncbi:MAG: addiction module protein [Bacteroidota bacterium]
MTVVELKAQLHSLIEQEESLEKLEAVQTLLSEGMLSEAQKKELDRRLKKLEAGETQWSSWEEAKSNIRKRRHEAT